MTTGEAKEIIKNKDAILEGIARKRKILYEDLCGLEVTDDEMYREAALAGHATDGLPRGSGGHTDNSDVLLRVYRQKKEWGESVRSQMWELSEQEESVRRMWSCFLALQEPYYGILHSLYVDKDLYSAAEASSGFSHRAFEEHRRRGLEMAVHMFYSGTSPAELMGLAAKRGYRHQKAREKAASKTSNGTAKDSGSMGQSQPGTYIQLELPLEKLT